MGHQVLAEEGGLAVKPVATMGDNCVDRYLPPLGLEFVGGNALNVAVGLRVSATTSPTWAPSAPTRPAGPCSPRPGRAGSTSTHVQVGARARPA